MKTDDTFVNKSETNEEHKYITLILIFRYICIENSERGAISCYKTPLKASMAQERVRLRSISGSIVGRITLHFCKWLIL
jgi:hypothetical protein